METPSIELFLGPAGERGQSLARGLDAGALAEAGGDSRERERERDGDARPARFLDAGGDQGSLRDQGWGVIAPRGAEGDRLLALVRPLIERRAEEQDAEVPVYRVPPDLTAPQAVAWLDHKLVGNEYHGDIPGYLLMLGRPDQVSFDLQQVLGSAFCVGRLGFDAEADYAAYADKLVRGERAPPRLPRAVYFTARDGTPATELGHHRLMQPCIADAQEQRAAGKLAASELVAIEEDDPARGVDRLLAAAAASPGGLLFSCSHGAGAPRTGWSELAHQRALQGAPCLGGGEHLTAELVAKAPFVPGGIWLLFACFGAGTPRHSAYHHWLARLQEIGEHEEELAAVLRSLPREGEPPFLAATAQAALANPAGPTALIGHLDLAWSYGFQDLTKMSHGERHRRFHELVAQLLKGTRIGLALGGSLLRARNQMRTEVTIAADAEARAGDTPEEQRIRTGHRWMALQDLDGYVVLGDPAARLAVPPRPSASTSTSTSTSTLADAAAIPEPSAPAAELRSAPDLAEDAAEHAAPDAIAIEAAVHDLIAGRATADDLAGRYGVAPAIVEHWRRVYTEAGRAAVAALSADHRGSSGA
jgi:hypothetical protein